MKLISTVLIFSSFFVSSTSFGQNLIQNPSGESGASNGWTIVQQGDEGEICYGNNDWFIQGGEFDFPIAQDGNSYFFSGCESNSDTLNQGDLVGEIYQDVDVSAYQESIDDEIASFTFSGYLQTWSEGNGDDEGRITVEYRDADGTVLSNYDTENQTSIDVWTEYTDTRNAPIGTRTVRVILRSYIYQPVSVDAYFDNLSLTSSIISSATSETLNAQIGDFYPNPSTSGLVNLDYTAQNSEEIVVSVFDVTGKLVGTQQQQISSGENNLSFDFADLNTGIYVVNISDKVSSVHRKLVIKK